MVTAVAAFAVTVCLAQSEAPAQPKSPPAASLTVRPAGVDLSNVVNAPLVGDAFLVPVPLLKQKLTALPKRAWSAGRVVAVEEMAFLPAEEERLQANLEATLAVLQDLNVEVRRRPRAAATIENAEWIVEREGEVSSHKGQLLDEALAVTDAAIAADPAGQRAVIYRVRLLEMRSRLTADRQRRAALQRDARDLWRHVVAERLAPRTPAPTSSGDFSAALFGETFAQTARRLHAIESGQHYPRPVAYWRTVPRFSQAQPEAPIVRAIIGPDGAVMNAEMVRGDAAVARACLEAARLWFFTPPWVEGRGAVAWIMLIAFDPRNP
jgi:hypothetical protein